MSSCATAIPKVNAQSGSGLSPRIVEIIATYRPSKDKRLQWPSVAEFVRECVTEVRPPDSHRTREYMRVLAAFTMWCRHQGIPLDREEVFTPENVDRFIEHGTLDLSERTRSTYRALLRRFSRQLTVEAPWVPFPLELKRSVRHAPYSPEEVAGYWNLRQPSTLRHDRLRALLILGLGAGIAGVEACRTVASDVSRDENGVVWVQVSGTRPRSVPVLEEFGEELLRLSAAKTEGTLLGGYLGPDSSRLWHLVRHLHIPAWLPRLEPERLRATWLVHHIDTGVPVPALLKAAGLKTTGAYTQLLPYLRVPSATESAELLSGRRA